ncbi:hypothetical protein GRI62_05260 [Erythrobacter arachoides]|uniref:Uncharacterized protein n=1 Tax=Aurantiacibacter arachoides TaxID=1850444 RepID=A0A845A0K9_9SPHN|nr:hypothetical protein [Aurantiacibacter arachoides]MXO93012.1 hypothetical protein [Aurantiacibacter arachoides]GGD52687.1 hypothetical protein GCM10011411_10740 [Aurantiacibacter arachoides]
MTDHPSTYRAADTHREGIQWDDRASLHRNDDGGGVLDGAKGVRKGTFAEMIRFVMMLPEGERSQYHIQKAGDREYSYAEIADLATQEGFPAA